MGHLILVRHGQASFLEANYDKLSSVGLSQSIRLGEYWANRNVRFDRVCSGPCVRQIETAQAVAQAYQRAGVSLPDLEIYPEFEEYSGDAALAHGLDQLLGQDEELRRLHTAFEAAQGHQNRRVTFQRMFERILAEWVSGALHSNELEKWSVFCARVNSGIGRCIASAGRARRIAVFTSGGPIAIAMQRALHLAPQTTIQTSFMCHNASWSEFLFSGSERFSLSTFNASPHLDHEPAMLTYR